ncbi:MAG: signal peptide peptidase SppA [Deltaproteobacteria bacterium]|nr:signal peptide peptidase SppA [Deltaproteobacteria bacterium]
MKKILGSLILLSAVLSGCVSIDLPRPGPLKEQLIGGKGGDKVLLLDISGVITDEEERGLMGLRERVNLTARVKEELELASKDKNIKAVVLRINSPGGAVTTCDIIAHEVAAFKKKSAGKAPVVASLLDIAASGGYYIAASADRIVAHPTTITGSIGVIVYSVNVSGLMEKIGITGQTIKSGDKKDILSPLRQMTEDERRILQTGIDEMYNRFLDVILETRKEHFTMERLKEIADGRVYTARQALDLKLVDSIGYLDDAIEAAKGLAGIKDASVVTYAPQSSYKNNIYSADARPTASPLSILGPGLFGRAGFRFMYLWAP